MKPTPVLCAILALTASASAQYFSDGWKPGQAAYATKDAHPPSFTPGAQPAAGEGAQPASGGLAGLFTSGPIASLLASAGVNLSAAVNTTEQIWDPRVPLITDDNWEAVVVNETLSPEEEERRTWFLVITTTLGTQTQGGLSKIMDREYDAAFNQTMIEQDLPDVRWGRIDYLNVTYLTTKWNIWSGPWIVVARDRGQTLRFYNGRYIRANATAMRTFLQEENWKLLEPWSSSFAPGGDREFVLHYFALGLKAVYDQVIKVPKFVLMIGTGLLGSLVMRLMHRGGPAESDKPKPKAAPKPKVPASAAAAVPTPPTTPKKTPSKKKGGKK